MCSKVDIVSSTQDANVCRLVSISERNILRSVSMSVPKNSIYGLLGPSGCGKTTLLRCILGMQPYVGQIYLFGCLKKPCTVVNKKVCYMPQSLSLYKSLTARETLSYFAQVVGLSNAENRIDELLDDLNIPNNLVFRLSGGQARRLSFAASIINHPSLLILDEPTVGVDPILRERIWARLKNHTQHGGSVIITTHYIEETVRADRIGFLCDGHILIESKPRTLMRLFGTDTLEKAIYFSCLHGEKNIKQSEAGNFSDNSKDLEIKTCEIEFHKLHHNYSDFPPCDHPRGYRQWLVQMKAILTQQMKQIFRQSETLIAQIVLPILISSIFCACVGTTPYAVPLAVINNDRCIKCPNIEVGNRFGISTILSHEINASFHESFEYKLKCFCAGEALLGSINSYMLKLIPYSDTDVARKDSLEKKNWGYLEIPEQFSDSMRQYIIKSDDYEHHPAILHVDATNILLLNIIMSSLKDIRTEMFGQFSSKTNWMTDPIQLVSEIFGKFDKGNFYGIRDQLSSGLLILQSYSIAFSLIALAYQFEKLDGVYARTFISGVTHTQILLGHLINRLATMLITDLAILLLSVYVFGLPCKCSIFVAFSAMIFSSIFGMSAGLMVSSLSNSIASCAIMGSGFLITTFLISGLFWPIESLPYFVVMLSFIQPNTLLIDGLRSLMIKGTSVFSWKMMSGYFIGSTWAIIFLLLVFCVFKLDPIRSKFKRI